MNKIKKLSMTFKPNKAQELIHFMLQQSGREFGAIELSKILYLIDVEYYRFCGHTLTGEKYIRQQKGPMICSLKSYTSALNGYELFIREDSHSNNGFPKRHHILGDNPRFMPSFDLFDRNLILRVLKRVISLTPIELEKLAYDTEPMKKILTIEKTQGKKEINTEIDFSLLTRNSYYVKWLENQQKPIEVDTAYQKHLKEEREEFLALIS